MQNDYIQNKFQKWKKKINVKLKSLADFHADLKKIINIDNDCVSQDTHRRSVGHMLEY